MTSPPDEPTMKEIWVFLVEFPESAREHAVEYVLNGDGPGVTVNLAQRLPFPAPPQSLNPDEYELVK